METRRLIIAMSVGLGLILLYMWGLRLLDERMGWNKPPPAASQAQTRPSTGPATQEAATQVATTGPTTAPAISAAPPTARIVATSQPAVASLGSDKFQDPTYALQLNVEPTGAAIQSVILNDFKKTARGKELYSFQQPWPGRLDAAPLASRSVTVNNTTYELGELRWGKAGSGKDWVEYSADLMDGGKPLLTLLKRYEIFPRSSVNEGYEIRVTYGFVNHTGAPLALKSEFNGTNLPPTETQHDRQVVSGVKLDKNALTADLHPIEEFKPDKDNGQIDLTRDSKKRLARWAGAVSNYFGAIVLPVAPDNGLEDPTYISSIVARGVDIEADKPIDDHQAYLVFQTAELKVAPGQTLRLPLDVYFGPKWRKVVDQAHYTSYPRQYNLLLAIQGWCGEHCTFEWLISAIVGLLTGLHYVLRDWGLAIIGLVAIVRLLLHPITRQSQISMAKMSKMGPEMKRLQEKYKDDKEALNKAMVEFHKQQGLGPYLGCLPMFLQMPIWVALYGVLQNTFELRHAPFLWNLTWIHDLAQPDYLYQFAHPISIWFFDLRGINLVPVLLAVVMAIQTQFMPKPVAATPEQMKQQQMMQWLSPAMFLLFFYNLPSGLNLYIFASTGVGIIESKIVRDHIKAREEAEKAGRVFIETKPTRGSKRGRVAPAQPQQRRGPFGWLAGRWARLLEHAERVRQEQERRDKRA